MAESKIIYQPQYSKQLSMLVDISQYDGVDGYYYTCPCDGIVAIECAIGVQNQCYCIDGYSNAVIAIARSNGTYNGFASLNVRKGQALAINGNSIQTAVFRGYAG